MLTPSCVSTAVALVDRCSWFVLTIMDKWTLFPMALHRDFIPRFYNKQSVSSEDSCLLHHFLTVIAYFTLICTVGRQENPLGLCLP